MTRVVVLQQPSYWVIENSRGDPERQTQLFLKIPKNEHKGNILV